MSKPISKRQPQSKTANRKINDSVVGHRACRSSVTWDKTLQDLRHDGLDRLLGCMCEQTADSLMVAMVRQLVKQSKRNLEDVHNDATSVTVCGLHAGLLRDRRLSGRRIHALTWGHNQDRRTDWKQRVYVLTVAEDRGVPVYASCAWGNGIDGQNAPTDLPTAA